MLYEAGSAYIISYVLYINSSIMKLFFIYINCQQKLSVARQVCSYVCMYVCMYVGHAEHNNDNDNIQSYGNL